MDSRVSSPKDSGFRTLGEFYPFYSLASDFRMWWELNLGRLKFREHLPRHPPH